MDIKQISNVYMKLIDKANRIHSKNNLFTETNKNQFRNFRVNDFKKLLISVVGDEYKAYMAAFRELDWIICKSNRLTNVQRINGKPIRIITVDIKKYNFLKKLKEETK